MTELKTRKDDLLRFREKIDACKQKEIKVLDLDWIVIDALYAHTLEERVDKVLAMKPYWQHAQNCNLKEIQAILRGEK